MYGCARKSEFYNFLNLAVQARCASVAAAPLGGLVYYVLYVRKLLLMQWEGTDSLVFYSRLLLRCSGRWPENRLAKL